MSSSLKLDWCSHEAAKYACEHWHYSRSMPAGKTARVGVWEGGHYIGCVIFARGSNKHIGQEYGLSQLECIELVRVALAKHTSPVSKVLAIAMRLLCKQSPGIRLIVSFADPNEGHVGTIYQANGWIYCGNGTTDPRCRPYTGKDGRVYHWRTVAGALNKKGLPSTVLAAKSLGYAPLDSKPKYKYLYPLDDAMRKQIEPLRKPYPKRAVSGDSDTASIQLADGGASPTTALQYT